MIAVIRDLQDLDHSTQASIEWGLSCLVESMRHQDINVSLNQSFADVQNADLCILIHNPGTNAHDLAIPSRETDLSEEPGSFCILREERNGKKVLAITGANLQGVLYAILEIADRVKYAEAPLDELAKIEDMAEKPETAIRSITRIFASEVEDKPWFYDHTFWIQYLNELVTHRFNKFHLALGMGYDYGHDPGVKDNYFCFAYPFLVSVPCYDVSVKGLPLGEAEHNLSMLRFISEQAKLRGIHFQLGLWTHAYNPGESPEVNYTIEGLHAKNHAAYCREAVRTLLQACPAVDGITFRVHYESGIPEPAHKFWEEVFQGVSQSGRIVEIDMHSKGADDQMTQVALESGMPVVVSPKYWAEHMGLPYHQAAIRPQEMPAEKTQRPDLMALTATSRRFTRYGYADYLKEDRQFGIVFRLWPGTQRVLLWGDPKMAAGYARTSSFCGSLGIDLCEPLAFKARKGSGRPEGRDPYVDTSLRLDGNEWSKYRYYYRLWGRLLYNPNAEPESWQRYLLKEFGAAAKACEVSLAHASRILPLITTAHLPSAANNVFWPEMYTNMPIVRKGSSFYDFDTCAPYTFNAVSPSDPALFYTIDEFADDLLQGRRNGKYTPIDVAERLLKLSDIAAEKLAEAESEVTDRHTPEFRRLAVDVTVMVGLGRFFAYKLLAGLEYGLFERTGDGNCLENAVKQYRLAKAAWQDICNATEGIYSEDITFGYVPYMRGHWADRLQAIEEDLENMEEIFQNVRTLRSVASSDETAASSVKSFTNSRNEVPSSVHIQPEGFVKGKSIELQISLLEDRSDLKFTLYYRRVNQVENYCSTEMTKVGKDFTAVIPEFYTDSSYPILYYFVVKTSTDSDAWLFPGFDDNLSNQPYFLLRQQE